MGRSRHPNGREHAIFAVGLHAPSPPFLAGLAFVELEVDRLRSHQLGVGADGGLAAVHEDHLLHLREVVQPVGDQEHHLIFGVLLQISEDDVLGIAVQRGEGVVEDQHRARMSQRPCQRQPLRLTARKAGAAGAR